MSYMLFIKRFLHSVKESVVYSKKGFVKTTTSPSLLELADGAAMSYVGDTSILADVESQKSKSQFMDLRVRFNKNGVDLGVVPSNHRLRELSILSSRLIDRSIRPLFPPGFKQKIEIACSVDDFDGETYPDIAGINAASAALALSPHLWNGPVGAVRVGLLEKEAIVNPTMKEMRRSTLNLVVTSTHDGKIVMLDASGNNVSLQDFLMAIKQGQKESQKIAQCILELQASSGKAKMEVPDSPLSKELLETARSLGESKFKEVLTNYDHISKDKTLNQVRETLCQSIGESHPDVDTSLIREAVNTVFKKVFRSLILDNHVRCDERGLKDLRNISCAINLNKCLHGSSLFTQGQTKVLSTLTLDSVDHALKSDQMTFLNEGFKGKNFMLRYSFPRVVNNEHQARDRRNQGRRNVGHRALVERAILPVLPSNFPFLILLESEVLMSDGSSSMASVCGSSLALMESGVPISAPVAGVAMGLVTKGPESFEKGDYCLLTDIQGIEDYVGDMDFKIAGTKKGITALQMDLKLPGIPFQLVLEAIQQASEAKSKILNIMRETIKKPQVEKKSNWPATCQIIIPQDQRSKLLSHGGLNIKKVIKKTGVEITQLDELTYSLFAHSQMLLEDAKAMIEEILTQEREPELVFGAVYMAKITEIRDHGVMVTLDPTMRPVLIPHSQLDKQGISVGQDLLVQYFGGDPVSGEMRLIRPSGLPTDHFCHTWTTRE